MSVCQVSCYPQEGGALPTFLAISRAGLAPVVNPKTTAVRSGIRLAPHTGLGPITAWLTLLVVVPGAATQARQAAHVAPSQRSGTRAHTRASDATRRAPPPTSAILSSLWAPPD